MNDVGRHRWAAQPRNRSASVAPGLMEAAAREPAPPRIELRTAIELMQEAALVLSPVETGDYRVRHANDRAAQALGVPLSAVAGLHLGELMPGDTATALCSLCDRGITSSGSVEHVASAPDALTDLTGMPSTVVRVDRVGESLLCTWLPGWHPVGADENLGEHVTAGVPVADRLALAAAVDALCVDGFGVFSFDMTNGRIVMSSGLHHLLGLEPRDGVVDATNLSSLVEVGPQFVRAWQDLIQHAQPMDAELRLVPSLGGHTLRVLACANLGYDHHPVVVRGYCTMRDD